MKLDSLFISFCPLLSKTKQNKQKKICGPSMSVQDVQSVLLACFYSPSLNGTEGEWTQEH